MSATQVFGGVSLPDLARGGRCPRLPVPAGRAGGPPRGGLGPSRGTAGPEMSRSLAQNRLAPWTLLPLAWVEA